MLFMALIVILGSLFPGLVVTPAQAGILPITRSYIQTTIDTTNWEILAGVVSYEAGIGGHQVESKRMGASNLQALANSETPSSNGVYDLLDVPVGKAGNDTTENLVLCFPGSMSFSGWNDNSTAEDTARAQLIRNSMIYDLNAAFKFVYGDEYGNYTPKVTSGDDSLDARIEKYSQDMSSFLSHIPGTVGESFGVNGAEIVATQVPKNPVDSEVKEANYGKDYYVTIKRGDETRTFLYRMLKGYGVDGTGLPDASGDATKYIHWGTLAVEAFVNYFSDDDLQVTAGNVYDSKPGAIESAVAGLFGSFAEWIANTLGLWNFDELIFNGGVRGTAGYIGGVFPTNWEPVIWTFFFFSEVAAIIMLLYAIIYNVGRKAMATIDPVARANAIEQIKYLFIVAFLLAAIPIVLPLLISVSAELTGVFHDALGGNTAEARFRKLASNSGGLGAVLTYLLYLGALLYFNVFYVFRSLAIGLMIILAPIFIAMMALSESKRELAMAWFKEFCANLFIQPLQALMLSFILLVPDSGRNIDSIVMAYVMIPLTNLLRQMFFGSSGGLADRVGAQGKQAGSNVVKKIGGMAAGVAGGAIGAGALAALHGSKAAKETKDGTNTEVTPGGGGGGATNTGGSGGPSSGTPSSGGGEKKAEGKAGQKEKSAGTTGKSVNPGAPGGATELSNAAADNTGASDDKADGKPGGDSVNKADGSSPDSEGTTATDGEGAAAIAGKDPNKLSGASRLGHVAGGVALAALGGAGLGAIGGLTGRRYFGGPGGGGLVNQLSAAASNKGTNMVAQGVAGQRNLSSAGDQKQATAEGRYDQALDRKKDFASGGNAYTDSAEGSVIKEPTPWGSFDYSFKDKKAQKDAGIEVGSAGKGAYVATYDKNKLSENDWSNLEQLQNIWENGTPAEKEALEAAGITGFTPHYSCNKDTNQDEFTGASVTYDAKKVQENFGLSRDKAGILSSEVQGREAPQFVPDVPSYLNTPQAATGYGSKALSDQGLGVKVNGDTVDITAADAATMAGANVPENLAPMMKRATMGEDGQIHASVPAADFAQAYAVPTNRSTEFARSKASEVAPEGTAVPPITVPTTMTTVGSLDNFPPQSGAPVTPAPSVSPTPGTPTSADMNGGMSDGGQSFPAAMPPIFQEGGASVSSAPMASPVTPVTANPPIQSNPIMEQSVTQDAPGSYQPGPPSASQPVSAVEDPVQLVNPATAIHSPATPESAEIPQSGGGVTNSTLTAPASGSYTPSMSDGTPSYSDSVNTADLTANARAVEEQVTYTSSGGGFEPTVERPAPQEAVHKDDPEPPRGRSDLDNRTFNGKDT